MEIILKKLEELSPYENNPRNNDEAAEYVANSIQEFGFKVPIIVDKDGVIVAGHTRYKAAQILGIDKVPCIIADDLTEEQVKAFRLADNKVAGIATWDFEKLDLELKELQDFDMESFGFESDYEEDIEPIDDEGIDGGLVKEHSLRIDNVKVVITDEEYEMITKKLDDYAEMNGVTFGFVRWLLDD